jgi:hypothetical protein
MSLSGRKEVPTQEDIHVRVLDLTREIQHAKIECDAENYSKNPDDENGEAKLLKDLEFLKMKLCEYMISLTLSVLGVTASDYPLWYLVDIVCPWSDGF